MLKYNDSNIYSGYIKQLLHSFNLPQCQIGRKKFSQNIHYIENDTLFFYDAENDKSTKVSSYKENDKVENITKNLEIRSNLYDSYTHEYLGDYLRYLRDYKKLNLMSMYNCFSNVSANLNINVKGSRFESSDELYTIFSIPVKYNKSYKIAIEYHGTIEVCCGFYHNEKRFESSKYKSQSTTYFEELTYQKFSGLRFSEPIVYDKLSSFETYDYVNEKCLRMFLKIPTTCKSSIVILEYSNDEYIDSTNLLLDGYKKVLAPKTLLYRPHEDTNDVYDSNTASDTFMYESKSQLLSSNSGEVYLLADRLIEYLSNQAVTPLDPVIDNIRRLQRKIYKEYGETFDLYGIWDEKQRKFLYKYIIDNGLQNKYYDILAYLDKDVERTFDIEYIITGYSVDDKGKKVAIKEENDVWLLH